MHIGRLTNLGRLMLRNSFAWQCMSESGRLVVVKIEHRLILRNHWHDLNHLNIVLHEDVLFLRVVRYQTNTMNIQMEKNCNSWEEISKIPVYRVHFAIKRFELLKISMGLSFVFKVIDDQTRT